MKAIEVFLELVGYGVVANLGFALTFCFFRLRKFNKVLDRSLK